MNTILPALFLFSFQLVFAQHDHESKSASKKWEHLQLFHQVFLDSSFTGKEIQLVHFIVPAGARDTVVHLHDCQLIGYILEGQVITKLKNKPEQHLKKGDIFYEIPNEVLEMLRNPDQNNDAKILLYYLYNKGANLYKKL